jgi:3-deoxy-D-manno-octulosonic-acid transferase
MNIIDTTYNIATTALFSAGFPAFWLYSAISGRYQRGIRDRLGFISPEIESKLEGRPRIWIHAVSLGEVVVASSMAAAIQKRLPGSSIMVSTTTDHGFDKARETFRHEIPVVYAPFDTFFSVKKALGRVRPHVMVFLETEIWPAWIEEARSMGIRTVFANGRISIRTFKTYRKFRFFFRHVLLKVDAFSMISQGDADRIVAMGAERGRVKVNGNAKYDDLADSTDDHVRSEIRNLLNLNGDEPVFVCGSTRGGEEVQLLDAFERIQEAFPKTMLILAPRHIERVGEIAEMCRKKGMTFQFRSRLNDSDHKRTAPVLILDTFGELFKVYSAATFVFCGASLVALGGQNPLEPAAWGKPVFYGPSMEDFQDAKGLLEQYGVNGLVNGPEMLAEKAIQLLSTPKRLEELGARARDAVLGNRKASERHAEVIAGLVA